MSTSSVQSHPTPIVTELRVVPVAAARGATYQGAHAGIEEEKDGIDGIGRDPPVDAIDMARNPAERDASEERQRAERREHSEART